MLYDSGTISGMPIANGMFDFTVKATNSAGSDTKTLSITIVGNSVEYVITASAGTGGAISPNGHQVVHQGNNITFTIIPNIGYHINQILIDAVNIPTPLTIGAHTFTNVISDHEIHATFTTDMSIERLQETNSKLRVYPNPTTGFTLSEKIKSRSKFLSNTKINSCSG